MCRSGYIGECGFNIMRHRYVPRIANCAVRSRELQGKHGVAWNFRSQGLLGEAILGEDGAWRAHRYLLKGGHALLLEGANRFSVYNLCVYILYICIYTGRGSSVGRMQASHAGDQRFGSWSSQTRNI